MNVKKILRKLLLLFCYFNIGLFLFLTICYLFFDSGMIGMVMAIMYPGIAPLLSFVYLLSGIIIIRFSFMKNRRNALIVVGICAFIFIVALLPYLSIPYRVADANNQMLETYGAAWTDLDTTGMRPVPFSIYDSIFGIQIKEATFSVQTDILYLDNGNDSFYFDWYKPNGEGPFPVIIAIHGGGWVMGSKGAGNVIPFNKYFASKGYCVFDINYGVYNVDEIGDLMEGFGDFLSLVEPFVTPDYNQSYTVEDQLENIGYFTKVLELNSSKYHADLNNTFIAGRSAGGHLAATVTLGYKNPLFAGNFSSSMNITGGIWFYPPTDLRIWGANTFLDIMLAGSFPLAVQYDRFSPAFLLTNSTVVPPIMICFGTKDSMAGYSTQGLTFHQLAQEEGETCIFVTIPWAGHAFDINFQTYGGQMSTYYIERFMALEMMTGG